MIDHRLAIADATEDGISLGIHLGMCMACDLAALNVLNLRVQKLETMNT